MAITSVCLAMPLSPEPDLVEMAPMANMRKPSLKQGDKEGKKAEPKEQKPALKVTEEAISTLCDRLIRGTEIGANNLYLIWKAYCAQIKKNNSNTARLK